MLESHIAVFWPDTHNQIVILNSAVREPEYLNQSTYLDFTYVVHGYLARLILSWWIYLYLGRFYPGTLTLNRILVGITIFLFGIRRHPYST